MIWELQTTVGDWVNSRSAPAYNAGANDWSGGSVDPVIAMDATTGKEVWWRTIGPHYNTESIPSRNGSGMIWFYGISNYHAVDDASKTLYISATNRGVNYFTDGIAGHKKTAPHTIQDGLRNGTIIAMNLLNGKVKWQYATKFPPRVSPLVTNKIVIAGYIPFADKTKTTSNHAKATSSGIILALDKETGSKLWEYDLQAPIGQVGPSIGDGMLFVPTGKIYNSQHKVSTNGEGSLARLWTTVIELCFVSVALLVMIVYLIFLIKIQSE